MNKLINVSFSIHGRVVLDLERAMEDPNWDQVTKNYDLSDDAQFKIAIRDYITMYLRNETMLEDTPFTCGPADIYGIQMTYGDMKTTTEVQDGRTEVTTR